MEDSKDQEISSNTKAKETPTVDRVILGKTEGKLLSKWVEEFNYKAEGLVKVSKADLVNYLIHSHAANLSESEVGEIASRYYDETRWLTWAMTKLKDAKKKGAPKLFDDLVKFKDAFLSQPDSGLKKRRGYKAKENTEPNFAEKVHGVHREE